MNRPSGESTFRGERGRRSRTGRGGDVRTPRRAPHASAAPTGMWRAGAGRVRVPRDGRRARPDGARPARTADRRPARRRAGPARAAPGPPRAPARARDDGGARAARRPDRRSSTQLLPTPDPTAVPWTGPAPDVAVNLHGTGPQSHRALDALEPRRRIGFRCPQARTGLGGPRLGRGRRGAPARAGHGGARCCRRSGSRRTPTTCACPRRDRHAGPRPSPRAPRRRVRREAVAGGPVRRRRRGAGRPGLARC